MAVAVEAFEVQDPVIDQRRHDAVTRVAQWLRHHDTASVVSITCFGDRAASGQPDRGYDRVAAEADLQAALRRLPHLERVAAEVSKGVNRDERGWFRSASHLLLARAGVEWVEWMDVIERAYGMGERPFERLLDRAAELMADDLGVDWW